MTLSIILPSYKNAEILRGNLPGLLLWLNGRTFSYEVVVVDDGSDDKGETERVARENNCRFVALERNSGKGAAVRRGMFEAKGDFRIFTDADIPFDFEAIEKILFYLKEKEFDIAIGDRRLAESKYFLKIRGMRKVASGIFTCFVGRFVTTGFSDTQCGLKGFSARVAEDLFCVSRINGFAFDVELLYIALKRNYDIKRVPVHFRSNQEESSVNLLKHAPGMLVDLFRIKWNHLRGSYSPKKR
jgi:dolichyl-phosphate beta-glucosyltransferase